MNIIELIYYYLFSFINKLLIKLHNHNHNQIYNKINPIALSVQHYLCIWSSILQVRNDGAKTCLEGFQHDSPVCLVGQVMNMPWNSSVWKCTSQFCQKENAECFLDTDNTLYQSTKNNLQTYILRQDKTRQITINWPAVPHAWKVEYNLTKGRANYSLNWCSECPNCLLSFCF